jgi:hypothetical protein
MWPPFELHTQPIVSLDFYTAPVLLLRDVSLSEAFPCDKHRLALECLQPSLPACYVDFTCLTFSHSALITLQFFDVILQPGYLLIFVIITVYVINQLIGISYNFICSIFRVNAI